MPDPYLHVPVATFDVLAAGDAAGLEPDDDHHVRRVLRLSPGAGLVVSDGRGREAAARLTPGGVQLTGAVAELPAPEPPIHVVQALAKSRKVDDVIRAVTELGVSAVTVVAGERSVVKLTRDKAEKVAARWQAIARSAAGQSRRAHLPTVAGPVTVADLVASTPPGTVGLVPHVGAECGIRTALRAAAGQPAEVRVAIGPEGGWTDDEVAAFEEGGYVPVSLGRSVLRTEHAGLVAASAVAAVLGWMD